MAKKSKDATASPAKTEAKTKAPADPEKTRNLVTLLNTLALVIAITAFVLQLFAVLTHAWKYQSTSVQPLLAPDGGRPAQAYVADDSKIEQAYGLFSRNVKVYSNSDEQLGLTASTRFPRVDKGHGDLNQCLSQTSTYRAALLTCNNRVNSPSVCHCRRYPYWNAVIFFEIAALILLGLAVVAIALFTTQWKQLLKLAGAGLAFLAFLFLLIGVILILSHLKRETLTIADTYPHIYSRLANQVGKRYQSTLHKVARREAHETYRAYSLLPGQHPYNTTHFQQYSQEQNAWIYLPYTSLANTNYAPHSASSQTTTTPRPLRNAYGPLIYENDVFGSTRACIGYSTILSILATILALLLPAILAFSFLQAKTLGPKTTTTTTTATTVETTYIPVPQDVSGETIPLNQTTVVVREEQPVVTTTTTSTTRS